MSREAEVLRKVLRMPRDFISLGNLSMLDLLKRSGYMTLAQRPSLDAIKTAIQAEPECVDDWLLHSGNQRCDGWYILEHPSAYEVGVTPGDGKVILLSPDRIEACALYVREELQTLKNIVNGVPGLHRQHGEEHF